MELWIEALFLLPCSTEREQPARIDDFVTGRLADAAMKQREYNFQGVMVTGR